MHAEGSNDNHTYIEYGDYNDYNTTIYVDLNHNNVLDNDEPNITVRNNALFAFNNLQEGNYLIRTINNHSCIQLYPGLNGSHYDNYQSYYKTYDNFVDVVNEHYHNGESFSDTQICTVHTFIIINKYSIHIDLAWC